MCKLFWQTLRVWVSRLKSPQRNKNYIWVPRGESSRGRCWPWAGDKRKGPQAWAMGVGSFAHYLCIWKLQSCNKLTLREMRSVGPMGAHRLCLNTQLCPGKGSLWREKSETLPTVLRAGQPSALAVGPSAAGCPEQGTHETSRTERTKLLTLETTGTWLRIGTQGQAWSWLPCF